MNNNIKLNKYLQRIYEKTLEKFNNKKILGIHFRGTSYKRSAGHPLPATKKQMMEITKKILKDNDVDIIFLVTEELDYLSFFKKNFKSKLFYLSSSYRSNKMMHLRYILEIYIDINLEEKQSWNQSCFHIAIILFISALI